MVSFELIESTDRPPARAASLLTAWQHFNAMNPDGPRPTRQDFTPFSLKPWLGAIDVYELENLDKEDGPEFRMRLNGTEVVAITGEDWTGKTARDIDRKFGFSLHDEMLAVCAAKQPVAHHIRIFQKDHVLAYRLLLPIFSEAGDGRVVQIFLAVFPLD